VEQRLGSWPLSEPPGKSDGRVRSHQKSCRLQLKPIEAGYERSHDQESERLGFLESSRSRLLSGGCGCGKHGRRLKFEADQDSEGKLRWCGGCVAYLWSLKKKKNHRERWEKRLQGKDPAATGDTDRSLESFQSKNKKKIKQSRCRHQKKYHPCGVNLELEILNFLSKKKKIEAQQLV